MHRQWDEQKVIGDVAMLKLADPLTFTASVRPICLPRNGFSINNALPVEDERDGPVCIITGWGSTMRTADSNILQQATIPVITYNRPNKPG